jgi:hypothetical protein
MIHQSEMVVGIRIPGAIELIAEEKAKLSALLPTKL